MTSKRNCSRWPVKFVPKRILQPDEAPRRIHALVDRIAFAACVINDRSELRHLSELGARFFSDDRGEDRDAGRRAILGDRHRPLFTLGWGPRPRRSTLREVGMNVGKTLFAQVMDFVPWRSFGRIVDHDGNAIGLGGKEVGRSTLADGNESGLAQLSTRRSTP